MIAQSSSSSDNIFRTIRVPAYVILTLALVLPLMDYFNGLVPFHLGDPIWRFGATSLVASYAVATTAQLFFLFVVAAGSRDRKVLIAIGCVTAAFGVALLGASGLYGLDALQARSRTSAATQPRLEMTAGIALVKLIALVVANVVVARGSFKAARLLTPVPAAREQVLMKRQPMATAKTDA